jgi:hypothetical protein
MVSPLSPGNYPFGFFDFEIGCVPPYGTVTLTMIFPSTLPPNTVWVKVHDGTYSEIIPTSVAGNMLILTLTDADGDGFVNDPGGPKLPANHARPVGGYIEPADKLIVVAPYLALFGAIAAAVVMSRKKLRELGS